MRHQRPACSAHAIARARSGFAGITVNAVAPGYIETPMTAVLDEKQRTAMMAQIPLGRAGTDLEIAQSVAFSRRRQPDISPASVDVNGGMFMGIKPCLEMVQSCRAD